MIQPTGQFDENGNPIWAAQNPDGSVDYYADDGGQLGYDSAPSGPIVDFGYGEGASYLPAEAQSLPAAPTAQAPQAPREMYTEPPPSIGARGLPPNLGQYGEALPGSTVAPPIGAGGRPASPGSGLPGQYSAGQAPPSPMSTRTQGFVQRPFASSDPSGFPSYQDGSMHPAFGGPMRTPGGSYAQGGMGGNAPAHSVYLQTRPLGRRYHENAGTLSAGGSYPGMPGPPPRAGEAGRGGSASGFGGGGGGGSALYQAWRSKLTSKLYPGSGSGYSGASTYGGSSGSTYGYEEPKKPKLTGYARGMDPNNAEALYSYPTMMLPRVARGIDTDTPFYEMLSSLPGYEMALLNGSRRKATDTNALNTYVNSLGRIYDTAAATGDLPSYQQMKNQFMAAKPKSTLGQMFRPDVESERYVSGYTKTGKPKMKKVEPTYEYPPLSTAAETAERMVGAIGTASAFDPRVVDAMTTSASHAIDQFGARNLNKDPRRMQRINRIIGNRVLL